MKTSLYDVYIDNQIIKTHTQGLKDMLKVSDADKDKYAKLNNQRYVSPRHLLQQTEILTTIIVILGIILLMLLSFWAETFFHRFSSRAS